MIIQRDDKTLLDMAKRNPKKCQELLLFKHFCRLAFIYFFYRQLRAGKGVEERNQDSEMVLRDKLRHILKL